MTGNRLWLIVGVATAFLAAVVVLIAIFPTGLTSGNKLVTIKDIATILAVIGLASVGIERLIEGIWSIVDISAGAFWPLNEVAGEVNDFVKALSQAIQPFFDQLRRNADDAVTAINGLDPARVDQERVALNTTLNQLVKTAGKSGSSQSIYIAIAQKLLQMQKDYNIDTDTVKTALEGIKQGADDLDKFIQSLDANPGRKVLSLYLGGLFGLLIAWSLGLDLLSTVLTTNHSLALGIIVAGIVMGLGSSPAHEIIQAVQDYRKSLPGKK